MDLRESLLGLADPARRPKPVEFALPDLPGHKFCIRQLSAGEREMLDDGQVEQGPDGKIAGKQDGQHGARWLIACLVDADGKPLFSDDDAERLAALPSGVARRLLNRVLEVNEVGRDLVAEEAKNSDAGQPLTSPSASPAK
jgi:hypothetical protein